MRRLAYAFTVACLMAAASSLIFAQGRGVGPAQGERHAVLVPDSTLERAEDHGLAAHTNHVIRFDPQAVGTAPSGETPDSIRQVYNLPSVGGGGTIFIVDAYHYPTALSDFNRFSTEFGLPVETSTNPLSSSNAVFQVVYASGRQPRSNCGWAQEAALDIEWAHAMAPSAKIVLVEATSNSFSNLFAAVDAANHLGASQVSMSWGGSEFSGESSNDSHFTRSGVVYFASSGDTGGATIYPGVSPNVVSAGGTTIHRDASGNFLSETGWSGSGGGRSRYEPRPSYQNVVSAIVGSSRGAPDYSFDADPNSGVSVYDSTSCQGMSGWMVFGGTSVAAPSLAGIVNLAGMAAPSSNAELTMIYSAIDPATGAISANFRDIVSGTAGSFSAKPGWDFVTGVGSTRGVTGK